MHLPAASAWCTWTTTAWRHTSVIRNPFFPLCAPMRAAKPLNLKRANNMSGVKFQPKNQNSFITLAYFDLTRTDFLTPDPITYANVQRGEANSRGVELEGVASLDNGLNLTANYTYLNTNVTKSSFAAEVGEPLEYTPEHKASAWADYTVLTGIAKGWGVGGGARFIGTSFGNSYAAKNTIEVPCIVLFDASTHYNWKQFQFSLNLQNALDKEYIPTPWVRPCCPN